MTALHRFETQYRLNEYAANKSLRSKDSAVPTVKSRSYLRWVFPDFPTETIKLSNLQRYPLSRYYYADDGSFLPHTLDHEFLQVITTMHSNDIQKPDRRYILRPLYFLPFMDKHPYFTYSLEKHFGYYQLHLPRNPYSISLSSQLLSCVQASYGYNPKLVQECERAALWQKLHPSANNVVKTLREITDMLTEWVQLFSSQYYSFSHKMDIFHCSIIDLLTVELEHVIEDDEITSGDIPWKNRKDGKKIKEIPPIYIEPQFYAIFSEPAYVENPRSLVLAQFREFVNSPDLERRLSFCLNEASADEPDKKGSLSAYTKSLCNVLAAAKASRDYTDVYALLSALFSDSKSLKPVYPQIPLKPLKELTALFTQCKKKMKEDQKVYPDRSESEQLAAEYKASLHKLVSHMLAISCDHQSSENKTSFGHMGSFWFNHEDMEDYISGLSDEREDVWPKPLLFEPNDYISMPCTKMFFTRVHREFWPDAFSSLKDGTCCIADYYIGACATAHISEQLQSLIPTIEPQQVPYISDETDEVEEHLLPWRWARSFFQVDEAAPRHTCLQDSDPQLLALDVEGKDFPLLSQIMQWFYPLSQSDDSSVPESSTTLKNLITSELLAYEGECGPFEEGLESAPTLQYLHDASKALHEKSPISTLTEQLMRNSNACWKLYLKNPNAYLNNFDSQVKDGIISILRESIPNNPPSFYESPDNE